jgi:dienelactone hydrolase
LIGRNLKGQVALFGGAAMKKFKTVLMLGFLALLIVPVLVNQIAKPERRSFEWVELGDTNFQDVRFKNTAQNLELAGMLFVPEGEGPFPAAVIIHGSGTSHRDSGWYLTLTQYLQENGVVVLLPDKRGSEYSEGDWRTASFEDLATDSVAAVGFLKHQAEIAISGIGVIGLSQGGHIAPVVADQTQDIAFLVNIVGGAVPMHDLLVYEETHNLREAGILPGLSDLLAYPASWSIIKLRQKAFWDAIGNFDPAPYWQRLAVESLVLYGENDTNVPSIKSAEILRSLANPNINVRIYAGSGHALESPEGKGKKIFREDALEDIRDFIHSLPTLSQ